MHVLRIKRLAIDLQGGGDDHRIVNRKAVTLGEECFFYHSVQGKEVVGIVKVVKLAHPDSTAELKDGKVVWECVDVVAVRKLKQTVTLEAVKAEPRLASMALVKLSRLSVSPVGDAEWKLILEMAGEK